MPSQENQAVFLVALELKTKQEPWTADESLDELENLVTTAGGSTVGREIQSRDRPDPAVYIGRGKAEEIRDTVQELKADLVVFDGELSPIQQRNLEEVLECGVIDRTTVILDIFALRAHSREAKLQVELAQLNYRLPRMTGKGTELSRLGAGIGTRGPGETKLEVDRRRVRDRIAAVKKELTEVQSHRERLRKGRAGQTLPVVALTGYTNAGKSTLHRALAESDVLVEDRLFATLDATTRRVVPKTGEPYLLVDTVGFIHKLPTLLIAAFRSTLEEVNEADLLLHVVDVTHPKREEQMETVQEVLAEIGAGDKPVLVVYNKADELDGGSFQAGNSRADTVNVSAKQGHNLDQLQQAIQKALSDRREVVDVVIPYEQSAWASRLLEHGQLISLAYRADGTHIKTELEKGLAKQLYRELDSH